MKHFSSLREAYKLCDAIGSPVRLEILEKIIALPGVNLSILAQMLHLTNGALTGHIKKLESAGLITVKRSDGARGKIKQCTIVPERIVIEVAPYVQELASPQSDTVQRTVILPEWLSVYADSHGISLSQTLADSLKAKIE